MKTKTLLFIAAAMFWLCTDAISQTQAQRSDDFVHYMGINYNFGRDGGQYDDIAITKLDELNIRFVRSWINFIPANKVNTIKDLGIRVNGLWKDGNIDNPLGARTKIKSLGPDLFDFIEGHNEPDLKNKTDTYGGCSNNISNSTNTYNFCASKNYQDDMYDDLKSDNATSALPVIAVSLARSDKIQFLAPIKHDRRNLHYYPGLGTNSFPTSGIQFGGGLTYQQVLDAVDDYGTTKEIHMTETGHSPGQYSELAQAKYVGRIYTEFKNTINNLEKVYYFKLLRYSFNPYGLANLTGGNTKPFNALKGMISLLSDASYSTSTDEWNRPTFTPGSLSISYSGKNSTTHDLLLQKANGDYYLLIWQEVNSYIKGTDPNSGSGDLNPADDNLTLTLGGGVSLTSATQYRYDNNFNYQSSNRTISGGNSITLDVPDHVMVIKLTVGTNPGGPITLQGDQSGTKNGTYYIKNKETGRYLYATGNNGDAKTRSGTGDNASQWTLSDNNGDAWYNLINVKHGSKLKANGTSSNVNVRNESNDKTKFKLQDGNNDTWFTLQNKKYQANRLRNPSNNNVKLSSSSGDRRLSQIIKVASSNARVAGGTDSEEFEVEDPTETDIFAYPNPARTTIEIFGKGQYDISIYNLSGQEIRTLYDLHDAQTIDISNLKKGVYILHKSNLQGRKVQRLIIQ